MVLIKLKVLQLQPLVLLLELTQVVTERISLDLSAIRIKS